MPTDNKVTKLVIPQKFKPLLDQKHEYYIFHSGRGMGKSVNIIICLILLAAQEPMRILCVREIMSSLSESVKATIEEWIENLHLSHLFVFTRDEIRCVNGSVFLFRGLQTSRAINIKSISNIRITFVEEAEAISESSWELLVPSVMRRKEKDCSIVCALNPRYEEDVIAQRFLINTPPPRSYVCKLLREDNPYFEDTQLPAQMAHDREVLSPATFKHKWEGEFITASEDCLFSERALQLLKDAPPYFEREKYVQIVVSCDPASTAKQYSNRYGIVVVGITKKGEFHCIENASSHCTPFEFATKVSELYQKYGCECAVVETNQGGDFLKATIVSVNPFIRVEEVRATSDKVQRALPVANLAAMGKVRLFEIGRNELLREMKNMTIRGYMGAAGESPDMLDALGWGIYYLGKLRDLNERNSFYTKDLTALNLEQSYYSFDAGEFVFSYHNTRKGVISVWEVKESQKVERAYFCKSWEVCSVPQMLERLSRENRKVFVLDDSATQNVILRAAQFYNKFSGNLDELAQTALPRLSRGDICYLNTAHSKFESFSGNVITHALDNFKLGEKENINIEALCHFAIEAV